MIPLIHQLFSGGQFGPGSGDNVVFLKWQKGSSDPDDDATTLNWKDTAGAGDYPIYLIIHHGKLDNNFTTGDPNDEVVGWQISDDGNSTFQKANYRSQQVQTTYGQLNGTNGTAQWGEGREYCTVAFCSHFNESGKDPIATQLVNGVEQDGSPRDGLSTWSFDRSGAAVTGNINGIRFKTFLNDSVNGGENGFQDDQEVYNQIYLWGFGDNTNNSTNSGIVPLGSTALTGGGNTDIDLTSVPYSSYNRFLFVVNGTIQASSDAYMTWSDDGGLTFETSYKRQNDTAPRNQQIALFQDIDNDPTIDVGPVQAIFVMEKRYTNSGADMQPMITGVSSYVTSDTLSDMGAGLFCAYSDSNVTADITDLRFTTDNASDDLTVYVYGLTTGGTAVENDGAAPYLGDGSQPGGAGDDEHVVSLDGSHEVYFIVGAGIASNTDPLDDNNMINLQISNDGGTTFESGASDYKSNDNLGYAGMQGDGARDRIDFGSGAPDNGRPNMFWGFAVNMNTTNSARWFFNFYNSAVNNSGNAGCRHVTGQGNALGGASVSGPVNALRFFTESGKHMDDYEINLYALKKSNVP